MPLEPSLLRRAVPPGSMLHYALLFAEPDERDTLGSLYALRYEIRQAVRTPQDPSVAGVKLAWWRDEIMRLGKGTAEHPISRELVTRLPPAPMLCDYLMETVEGSAMDLAGFEYNSLAELGVYCYRSSGTTQILACGAAVNSLDTLDPSTIQFGRHLGNAIRLIEIIRDVRRDAIHGRVYLPRDQLSARGIDIPSLSDQSVSSSLSELLGELARAARLELSAALRALPETEYPGQRVGLVLGALYHRLLDRIEEREYAIGSERIALPAMSKLWSAWRAARQALSSRSTIGGV